MANRKMGIVLIVIGLCMVGVLGVKWSFSSSFSDTVSGVNGSPVEEGKKTFDATAIKKVVVRNPAGNITVNGDPNAKEATVNYSKRTYGKWGFGSKQAAADRVKINIDAKGDKEVIEVIQPSSYGFWNNAVSVQLDITVPPNAELDIQSNVGTVDVTGMDTPVRVQSDVGSITIDGFRDTADAENSTGSISIRGGEAVKRVVANSATSRIDVEVPKDAQLRVHAQTEIGNISSDIRELDNDVYKATTGARLSGKIGDGSAGTVDLTSSTGSIRISSK